MQYISKYQTYQNNNFDTGNRLKGMFSNRIATAFHITIISFLFGFSTPAEAQTQVAPIYVGLDADFSGSAPQSGLAIQRGMQLAIDEINAAGGVLQRPLELVDADNRGVPARGLDNIDDFLELEDLVAVVGGLHSPVVLAQLEKAQQNKLILFSAWAAATPIIANQFNPNYIFRVSIRDEFAGEFLINAARQRKFNRPGLLLWRSGWGASNEKAMSAAMARMNVDSAGTEWFNATEIDLSGQISRLIDNGADVIMLVANPDEGIAAVRAMVRRDTKTRVPIISHWGITGTDFYGLDPDAMALVDLTLLQTYSFFDPPFPEKSEMLLNAYCLTFKACGSPATIVSPTGTAHAYDIVHLLARAITQAGTTARPAVRSALENLGKYEGLVRVYDPPFTAKRHDALGIEDFSLAKFNTDGAIVPAEVAK